MIEDRIIKQEKHARRENLQFSNISTNKREANDEFISKIKDVISSLKKKNKQDQFSCHPANCYDQG